MRAAGCVASVEAVDAEGRPTRFAYLRPPSGGPWIELVDKTGEARAARLDRRRAVRGELRGSDGHRRGGAGHRACGDGGGRGGGRGRGRRRRGGGAGRDRRQLRLVDRLPDLRELGHAGRAGDRRRHRDVRPRRRTHGRRGRRALRHGLGRGAHPALRAGERPHLRRADRPRGAIQPVHPAARTAQRRPGWPPRSTRGCSSGRSPGTLRCRTCGPCSGPRRND